MSFCSILTVNCLVSSSPQIFARYKKAQEICATLRGNNETKQYTVRIEQKDIAIKYREDGEQYWQDITAKFVHELDNWEMEKVWERFEDTADRKEYAAFTP